MVEIVVSHTHHEYSLDGGENFTLEVVEVVAVKVARKRPTLIHSENISEYCLPNNAIAAIAFSQHRLYQL